MTEESSLAEAVAQVDKLDELLLSSSSDEGGRTSFEIQPGSISYQANFDTNFEDRNGFITGIAKYMEEATVHTALNALLEEGDKYAAMLYTWRCCTRGIPQPKSNEDPNREQIHMMTVEVLMPEVEKLYNLMKFHKTAIELFCTEVKVLCHPEKRKEFVSSAYLLTLGKFINMFAVLDELKNIKSSIKIDFSTFRRAALFLKLMADAQTLQESQNLSVFLATPNRIRDNLKESLEKIQNYENVLADVINICVNMFEQKLYVTLDEKHMLIKVIGFCLGLVDHSNCNMYKLDSKKKIRIEKIDQIFKAVPVVPVYGDMPISPFNYIKNSGHYDASKWAKCSAGAASSSAQVDFVKLLPQISQDHLKFLSEIQLQYNSTSMYATEGLSETQNEKTLNLALKGLQLLSEWTSALLELHSWKLLHPTDHHQNKNCPHDAEEYERAIRFNYTVEEKSAVVQVIVMIKGLQQVMSKMELMLAEGIRRDIYRKLQIFVQMALREPLRKAMKHKKEVLRSVLMSVRDTCAEWIGEGPSNNQTYKKGPVEVKILKRFVGPSSTQLYLLRTMLESLISEKTCAKRALRKDIDSTHLPGIEEFHRRTFFWSYLQNFSETLEKCCDLGQMWFREFYLELTMGRRIQFPIEMSMPWILIDHVLNRPDLVEFVLFPLDLFNDSANAALNVFKKQWLFDELIAEVNLCFDQFVFKLSEQIFIRYKEQAASSLMTTKFRNNKTVFPFISTSHVAMYEPLMQHRRLHLIGHYINLNHLIRQRISIDILKSVQTAIAKFEEDDLSGVVQLDALIQINRETHRLLKIAIPSLDDFESIWREANHSVTSPHGRITCHILSELIGDFLPDFCYTGSTKRFVRTVGVTHSTRSDKKRTTLPVLPQYLWGSKQLQTTYSLMFGFYSGFVGEPHLRVIVNLLGYKGLTLVVKELIKICGDLINGSIRQWVKVLKESLLPKYIKAPSASLNDQGTPGYLAYYLQVLSSVIQHPGVKTELFQDLRKVGNAILFCLLIEQSLAAEESFQMCHVAPFQSIQQQQHHVTSSIRKERTTVKELEKEDLLHVCGNITKFGTETQRNLAKEGTELSGELLTLGLRIFPEVLRQIREILVGKDDGSEEDEENKSVWKGPPRRTGCHVMNMHRCGEFHRVWSVLQFVLCIPEGPNGHTTEHLFGDGLNWAGCVIIALLDQRKRFQTFDFCNHLRESYRDDGKDGDVRGINVRNLVRKIRSIQVLSEGIFSTVTRYFKDSEGIAELSENVRCYLPPIHKSLLENVPPEMEGQPPDVILQYRLKLRQESLLSLVTQNEGKGEAEESPSSEEIEIKIDEVVDDDEPESNLLSQRDIWDDFRFFEEEKEREVNEDVVAGGEDGGIQSQIEACGQDEVESTKLSILYQSKLTINENDSVNSVHYEASSGKNNN